MGEELGSRVASLQKPTVLLLIQSTANQSLVVSLLDSQGLDSIVAKSVTDVTQICHTGRSLTSALIDLTGFDSSIWSTCHHLRQQGIPFLVVLNHDNHHLRLACCKAGARWTFVKPVGMKVLLEAVVMLSKPEPNQNTDQ